MPKLTRKTWQGRGTRFCREKFSSDYIDDNKWLSVTLKILTGSQVIEIKQVNFCLGRLREKKWGSILKVSLQKLMKTHIEKMSTFVPVQKLMKTSKLRFSSDYIYENYGSC